MILDDEEAWQHYAGDGAEALREIEASLLVLEDDPADAACINRLYRGLHTLKGNSGFMGLARVESLAHVAEDLIGLVRDGGVALDPVMADLLLEVIDRLRALVEAAGRERRDAEEAQVSGLVARLRQALAAAEARRGNTAATARAPEPPAPTVAEVEAPFAPEERTDPAAPCDEVDPGAEAGYMDVFLSLAEETLPELSATISRLRDEPGAASLQSRLAELCEEFAFAAGRMGYQPLVDLLARMASAANGGEIANIGSLELQMFGWLADVEDLYHSVDGAEPAAHRTVGLTYQRACAGMAFGDLARLRALLDEPAAIDAEELTGLFRRLRATCRHYGFEGASRSCLDHFDQIGRARDTGEAPDAELVARTGEFVAQLGETIEAVNAGAEIDDVAGADAAGLDVEAVLGDLAIAAELRPHLTPEALGRIPLLLERGWRLFEIHADVERDATLSERLPAWISGGDVACLSSTVVPSTVAKDSYAYLFLVGASTTLDELRATFRQWDASGRLVAIHEVSRGGAPRAYLDPAPAPPPLARAAPSPVEPVAARPEPAESTLRSEPAAPETEASREAGKVEFLRIDARKVSLIMDLAGELGLASGAVTHHPDLEGRELEGFSAAAHKLEVLIRELQNEVAAMRLVPVAGVFQRMRRVVRDVSRRTGKKVDLLLVGEETEIDKVMVDALGDPLVHVLRNAIDHGIESPEDRVAAGKPPTGRIVLEAAHQGGEVTIEVSDDGRGLDRERILARARERGLVAAGATLTDDEILDLVFEPGFSTKEQIDELSGRGVGMDVIRTVIEGMRGRVRLRSTPGRGTSISLTLPLTLAFIDAMVVRERDRLFAVPIEKVFEVFQVAPERVAHSTADRRTSVRVRDSMVPVCWLHRYYGEEDRAVDGTESLGGRIVVVVQTSRGSLALPVDALLGNQQLMLKPLRGVLKGVRGAAGCGVLRTGDVALALDCEQLHA